MNLDLSIKDLFETRKISPLSDYDHVVTIDLYMPLVGGKAIGLYFALYQNEENKITNHENILINTQYSVGEMVQCLNSLEAVGLVRTYLGEVNNCRLFAYCLYAPKNPSEFFADPLFAGTIEKYIGKEKCKLLADKYLNSTLPEKFKPISMSFLRYFSPDLNDDNYVKSVLSSGGKTSLNVDVAFPLDEFIKALSNIDNSFTLNSFSSSEINYISRVNALYGYNVDSLAAFVISSFDIRKEFGKRLDQKIFLKKCQDNINFSYLKVDNNVNKKNVIHGDSSVASLLRKMKSVTPIEFITRLQKGNKPAESDIKLIQTLTLDMGLNNEVTNALLFYVLSTHNNTLPKTYVEKIGASLVREGIVTAIDAWNYFNKTTKAKNNINSLSSVDDEKHFFESNDTKKTDYSINNTEKTVNVNEDKNDNDEDEEEDIFADIFATLKKKK